MSPKCLQRTWDTFSNNNNKSSYSTVDLICHLVTAWHPSLLSTCSGEVFTCFTDDKTGFSLYKAISACRPCHCMHGAGPAHGWGVNCRNQSNQTLNTFYNGNLATAEDHAAESARLLRTSIHPPTAVTWQHSANSSRSGAKNTWCSWEVRSVTETSRAVHCLQPTSYSRILRGLSECKLGLYIFWYHPDVFICSARWSLSHKIYKQRHYAPGHFHQAQTIIPQTQGRYRCGSATQQRNKRLQVPWTEKTQGAAPGFDHVGIKCPCEHL